MSNEQEITVAEESRPRKDANAPTLSVLLGAIESFHTHPRVERAGAAVNISKQLEALHGNEDFTFA